MNSAIVNSIVISQVSAAYAPEGSHLVATTTLNSVSEERIKEQLRLLWGSTKWDFVQRYEIKESLPFMSKNSSRPIIRASESVVLAGDYLQIPSQQGAMLSGRLAAEELIQSMR
jgi:predicted NAD/FAD-dependent oxidoreductase